MIGEQTALEAKDHKIKATLQKKKKKVFEQIFGPRNNND